MPPNFSSFKEQSGGSRRGRSLLVTSAAAAILLALGGQSAEPANDLGTTYGTGWAHEEHGAHGHSYFSAKTFVDCGHTRLGYRQSADIFTGGYVHGPDGRVINYADAGILLENDDLHPGQLGRPNKVQLYGQASTLGGPSLLRYSNSGPADQRRYDVVCDTPLQLTFFVAGPDELITRYVGTFREKRTGAIVRGTAVAAIRGFVPADGWSERCERCSVRRVNTLAVNGGPPARAGSYFGLLNVLGQRLAVGRWSDSMEGAYRRGVPGDLSSYTLSPFAAQPIDMGDSPAFARSRPARRPGIAVVHAGAADEQLLLDER